MPSILALATAVPEHEIAQAAARELVAGLFAGTNLPVARLLPVFGNAEIARRFVTRPPEWYAHEHGFAEKNAVWREHALALTESAARAACGAAGVAPEAVDHVILVTTTGLATPSLDAHLCNRLPLAPEIRRSPLWGLGCAGGVGGIARAADWLRGVPQGLALVLAVELCSLTFVRGDTSTSNFVATALFGDGCGAALLAGDAHPLAANGVLEVVDSASHTWPDTLGVMGWEVRDEGLAVVFAQSIPRLVRDEAAPLVTALLGRHGLGVADLAALASHPGGAKVVRAYEEALATTDAQTAAMRMVLRDYGNMSSATVLFVLEEALRGTAAGGWLLSTSLGPGFTSEMLLLRRR